MIGDLEGFYSWIRWPGWREDIAIVCGDQAYSFYPPLWTKEGKGGVGDRRPIDVREAWSFQMYMRSQIAR